MLPVTATSRDHDAICSYYFFCYHNSNFNNNNNYFIL